MKGSRFKGAATRYAFLLRILRPTVLGIVT